MNHLDIAFGHSSRHWRDHHRLHGDSLAHAWEKWLACLPWLTFATFTFDPKRWTAVSSQLAGREAFWICTQTERLLRKPVGWIYASERGRSGRWHVHALLTEAESELSVPAAMWRKRNGHVDLRPVYSAGAMLYTTKEAALSGEVVLADTLGRYLNQRTESARVFLHPEDTVEGSRP